MSTAIKFDIGIKITLSGRLGIDTYELFMLIKRFSDYGRGKSYTRLMIAKYKRLFSKGIFIYKI